MRKSDVLRNLASGIADKGKVIKPKTGSILNTIAGFTKSSETGVLSISEFSTKIADNLLNELNVYRNTLFPVLNNFNTSINAKVPFIKSQEQKEITVREIATPQLLLKLKEDGIITGNEEPYNNGTSFPTSLQFDMDLEAITDVKSYFVSEEAPDSLLLNDVIVQYSDLELKEFLRKYGRLIFSSYNAAELNKGYDYVDYRALGVQGSSIIEYTNEILLMYGYIINRIAKPVSTNVSSDQADTILKLCKKDLEHLLGWLLRRYEFYVTKDFLVITTEARPYNVTVISENLKKWLDMATTDAWSAIQGCAPVIRAAYSSNYDRELGDFTVDILKGEEQKRIDDYNNFINKMSVIKHNNNVDLFKELYATTASTVWETFVDASAKENFSTIQNVDELLAKVKQYLGSVNDAAILSLAPEIAIYIVCKIMFDKTSFFDFTMDTAGNRIFANFSELSPKDNITIAGLMLAARYLINEIDFVQP